MEKGAVLLLMLIIVAESIELPCHAGSSDVLSIRLFCHNPLQIQWNAKTVNIWTIVANAAPARSVALDLNFPRSVVMGKGETLNALRASPGSSRTDGDIMAANPASLAHLSIGPRNSTAAQPPMPPVESASLGLPRIHLEESSTDPAQDLVLVVLTSSALVLLALVLLTISILYCQQFWKSQCQHVFLRSQNVSGQRSTFPTSAPTGFLGHELLSDRCSLDIKNFSSSDRPTEGLVKAVQFTPGMDVSGFHLPRTEPDTDLSKLMIVTSKTPPARSLLETQPLIRNSGFSNGSSRDSSVTEFRQDCSRDTYGPAKLSSCARELQHRWSHTPVECTELDLQTFSTWAGKGTADTEFTGKQELPSEVLRWSVYPAAQAGLSLEAVSVLCSSFQNPTIESGEHPVSSSSNILLEQL
ncbi:tumor necrosis factor receptor superfamily member 27 isoform 2-T2 [Liasis olivaceus]